MISARTTAGLDRVMLDGLRSSLVVGQDEVSELAAVGDSAVFKETDLVILSVSLMRTRMLFVLYFTPDRTTREHVATRARRAVDELSEQDLLDAVAESANLICGALSRELGCVFPQIGMSTPNFLKRGSADHLGLLKPGYLQHYRLVLNGWLSFHASLCVIEREDLDFELVATEQAADSGELEMF
jgi:hypothetical protein